jgi:hypothetical protein
LGNALDNCKVVEIEGSVAFVAIIIFLPNDLIISEMLYLYSLLLFPQCHLYDATFNGD